MDVEKQESSWTGIDRWNAAFARSEITACTAKRSAPHPAHSSLHPRPPPPASGLKTLRRTGKPGNQFPITTTWSQS
jgi:hypothetical protein